MYRIIDSIKIIFRYLISLLTIGENVDFSSGG
jgi:hypothetical protein